jgi:hypothetical protein
MYNAFLIESYPSLPENPEKSQWYEVAPEGSRCSEGSAWHGLVRLGTDAGKVLVFFLGGGVSLNEEMSRDNARRCVFAPTVILQDYIVEYGILSDAPENPFRNWTRLVVEYATGDFHVGTNEFRCTGVDKRSTASATTTTRSSWTMCCRSSVSPTRWWSPDPRRADSLRRFLPTT